MTHGDRDVRGDEVAAGVAQGARASGRSATSSRERVAGQMHVKKSLMQRLREGKASLLERIWTPARAEIAIFTAEEVFDLAVKGNVLIRGWGATLLLRPVAHIPCVRVCAPMEVRVSALMKRLDTDDEAFVRRRDRAPATTRTPPRCRPGSGVQLGRPAALRPDPQHRARVDRVLRRAGGRARQAARVPGDRRSRAPQLASLALEARVRAALAAAPATPRRSMSP